LIEKKEYEKRKEQSVKPSLEAPLGKKKSIGGKGRFLYYGKTAKSRKGCKLKKETFRKKGRRSFSVIAECPKVSGEGHELDQNLGDLLLHRRGGGPLRRSSCFS